MYFFVGFNSWRSDAAAQFLEEPKAPSNYGKEAAAAYIEKKKAEEVERCRLSPIIGEVTNLCILDAEGRSVLNLTNSGEIPLSELFHNWLNPHIHVFHSLKPGDEIAYLIRDAEPSSVFWGLDVAELFRMLAVERIHFGTKLLPLRSWWHNRALLDPYHILLDAEDRKKVSFSSVLRYLKLEEEVLKVSNGAQNSALYYAEGARRLAKAIGVIS